MIRDFEDADAEGASDLIAEHSPWFSTAEGTRHRRRAVPPRAHLRYWVAEDAGRIVGWGEAEFDWATEAEDVGGLWAIVHPDVQPFLPFSGSNPFIGLVEWNAMEMACVVAAVVGIAGALMNRSAWRPA